MSSRLEYGRKGEALAASYLEGRGWTILERNLRSRYAEIDLVACLEETLAFIEVKTWRSVPYSELSRAIGPRKRMKIRQAATKYVGEHPELSGFFVRYDVIFIQGEHMHPVHIEAAFDED